MKKNTHSGEALTTSTVVSPRMAWESIYMVEVVRSCPEMCRFCLASYATLPFRAPSVQGSLIPNIERGLEVTNRLGLLGASITQHPEFDELLQYLLAPERADVRMSISSVRTNTVTPDLCEALAARGTKSLTIAVESGSERVRDIVNKKLAQDEILAAVHAAQAGGMEALKLYGMAGVPGEEDGDVDATVDLLRALKKQAPKLRLSFGCSTFVPKAHTPFQWYVLINPAPDPPPARAPLAARWVDESDTIIHHLSDDVLVERADYVCVHYLTSHAGRTSLRLRGSAGGPC